MVVHVGVDAGGAGEGYLSWSGLWGVHSSLGLRWKCERAQLNAAVLLQSIDDHLDIGS